MMMKLENKDLSISLQTMVLDIILIFLRYHFLALIHLSIKRVLDWKICCLDFLQQLLCAKFCASHLHH